MGARITTNRILAIEPYRSIINLLAEYPNGLELKEIQFAIMEDHHVAYEFSKIQKNLGEILDQLIQGGKIKRYQSKTINRHKKTNFRNQEFNFIKGKRVRSNLENFLKKMMVSHNKVIYRENKKYKLSEKIVDVLLTENDKETIEKLRNIKVRSFKNEKINLYGFQLQKELSFDSVENIPKTRISEDIQKKIDGAIQKIKSGIDDLQATVDYSQGWSISKDPSLKYISNQKYLLIDRQLLIYYRSCLLESFKSLIEPKLDNCMHFKTGKAIVIQPNDELLESFKKHFYPSEPVEKIRSRLNNHRVNKEISQAFGEILFLKMNKMICSHMIAVVHSGSGTIVDDDLRGRLPDDIKDNLNIVPFVDSNEFLNNYFDSDDQKLKKMIADKNSLDADDLINFHKILL